MEGAGRLEGEGNRVQGFGPPSRFNKASPWPGPAMAWWKRAAGRGLGSAAAGLANPQGTVLGWYFRVRLPVFATWPWAFTSVPIC